MKNIKFAICLLFFSAGIQLTAQVENPNYDEELAKELKADSYGMKSYTLVLLHAGTNLDNTELRDIAFASHMDNINRLLEMGALIISGPVGNNDTTLRGILILKTDNIEGAKELMKKDQAVQKGYLTAQYFPYYGSAALPAYLNKHEKIWKKKP